MESIAYGVVLDMTSPSGLEISAVYSLFLGPFFGAMTLYWKENLSQKRGAKAWLYYPISDRQSENKFQNTDL